MTELAKLITVKQHAGYFEMLVDGQEFPWYIAPGITVDVDKGGTPGVKLTLMADRVEVIDALTPIAESAP